MANKSDNNGHPVIEEETAALVSTFFLGEALFGIDAMDVQEVITLSNITHVHHAPHYINGIFNLRGRIVTIVDLAAKLCLEQNNEIAPQHGLIVSWQGEHVGLLVDRVADVEEADLNNLSPAPANINLTLQKCVKGICLIGSHQVSILDVNSLLDEEQNEN